MLEVVYFLQASISVLLVEESFQPVRDTMEKPLEQAAVVQALFRSRENEREFFPPAERRRWKYELQKHFWSGLA